MLLDIIIMILYFTGIIEFLRVFLGLPLSWGGAALDAAIATLMVSIVLWLQTSFASEDATNTPALSEETAISAPPFVAERLSRAPSGVET